MPPNTDLVSTDVVGTDVVGTDVVGTDVVGTAKRGRPSTFGLIQCGHWDTRQPLYNGLRNDVNYTPSRMNKFLNNELFIFFAVFGWDDPEQTTIRLQDTTEESINARKAEIRQIEEKAKSVKDANEQDLARDTLVKRVRTNMAQRFLSKYTGPKKKTAASKVTVSAGERSASGIQKLLQTYMEKPTLRHQCQVWASSHPHFEAQVDQRLTEVRLEKGDPDYPRIGLWNTMASQGYAAADDSEKEKTVRKAKEILEKEMKGWEKTTTPPKSVAEAIEFMEASKSFLEDLMQFFAERSGGMAVMVLAGAGKVLLSQGTCDVAGIPKVLYGDIADEKPLLLGLAGRIHTQACLVSESKWGVRLSDGTPAIARPAQKLDQGIDVSLEDPKSKPITSFGPAASDVALMTPRDSSQEHRPADVPTNLPPETQIPDASAFSSSDGAKHVVVSTNKGGHELDWDDTSNATSSPRIETGVGDVGSSSNFGSMCTVRIEQHPENDLIAGDRAIGASMATHDNVHEPDDDVRRPQPRPRPTVRGKATQIPVNTAVDQLMETPAGITSGITALEQRVSAMSLKATVSQAQNYQKQDDAERPGKGQVNTLDNTQNQRAGSLSRLVSLGPATNLFAYQLSASNIASLNLKEYKQCCAQDGNTIEGRKKWFAQCAMTNFFLNVPKKLEHKVDLALACAVVRAYMNLELSGEEDTELDLSRYQVGHKTQPEYVEALQGRSLTNITRMTWHKKSVPGQARKAMQLDQNIGSLLGNQWACQQADVRRKSDGTLCLRADSSMDWGKRLAPGISGVRLLVLTLLCWGSEIDIQAGDERRQWNELAKDFSDVLSILVVQAAPYRAPEAELVGAGADAEKRKK
ncbi:unnamed protein product [Peniophora sp. CBMAI 1063]|nr:unnamed protein product [Peniophora sp. CBMAI 1063]